jgi:hypothetical protein
MGEVEHIPLNEPSYIFLHDRTNCSMYQGELVEEEDEGASGVGILVK